VRRIFYKNLKHKSTKILDSFRIGAWIHIDEATQEDLDFAVSRFSLDDNILADALDMYEVPRIEHDEGKTYLFTRFAYGPVTEVKTAPLLIVIGSDFFLTITPQKIASLDTLIHSREFYSTQKTRLLTQLLLTLDTDFEKYIKHISKDIHRVNAHIENINNKSLVSFVNYEYVFNEFLLGLRPDNNSLEKLLTGKYVRLFEDDRELIQDLYLTNEQLVNMCQTNIKYLVNIRDSYSTITTNNLNKTMKFLTSITLILTIPTMVFSFYGMNVHLPLESHPLAFGFIIAGTVIFSVLLLIYFNLKDLL